MSDDVLLLRRYVEEGSESAFTALVERHVGLVYAAAVRRCGDAHRANDVAQRVFTALARQAPRLTQHAVLTAWLYTTTRNIAVDLVRAERRRQPTEEQRMHLKDLAADASGALEWARVRPVLDEAIDSLSERDRTAVLLRFFERRRFAEIGAALRISEDGARMRVERATEKLRAWLARQGIASTADALAAVLTAETLSAAPSGAAATISHAALVAAAGTAGVIPAASALFSFMTATKVSVTLGVLGAMALSVALYQNHRARAVADTLAEAAREDGAVRANLQALRGHVQALEADNTALEASLSATRHATESAEAAARSTAASLYVASQPAITLANLLQTNAEFRDLFVEQRRIQAALQLVPLVRELHLTAAQAERLSGLLAEAAREAAEQRQPYAGPPPDALLARIRSEFGDAVAAAYAEFTRQSWARGLVTQLLSQGSFAGFTPEQAEQVTNFLVHASPSYAAGGEWRPADVDWKTVVQRSSGVLSPEQAALVGSLAAKAQQTQMLEDAALQSISGAP